MGERQEVFGSSTALEKEYLRLTALPTVDAVRPPEVLQQVRRGQRCWLSAALCGLCSMSLALNLMCKAQQHACYLHLFADAPSCASLCVCKAHGVCAPTSSSSGRQPYWDAGA